MPDSFEPGDSFEPEGGAEGGGGGDTTPSKPLIKGKPVDPAAADAEKAEEKRRFELAMSALSGGQSRAAMPEAERESFNAKRDEKALGQFIAGARGLPLVGGSLDEISALFQTGDVSGPKYESKRNDARQAINQSVADNPALPMVGSMAFAPALPQTALGRVGLGTAEGVAEGVGAAPTMGDTPKGALLGGVTGAVTSAAGEVATQGGKALGAKRGDVLAKNQANADKVIDSNFASARGAYGGNVSSGSNLLQQAERNMNDPRLPENLRAAIREWYESAEAKALSEQVARSNLGRGEDALGRIGRSADEMGLAAQQMAPEARAAAAQARIDDPTALKRRLRELLPKVVLPALGGAIAGPGGAAAGGLLGAVAGRSGTTVRNALADPFVSSRLLGAGETALDTLGRGTTAMTPEVSREALAPWAQFIDEEQQP